MVDGVIIEMGRYNIRSHIICRMLHRSKGINVLPQRQYDDTTGMLSRTPSDSCTSLHNPVNLTGPFSCAPFFIIILYISERGFICQGSNGPGSIGLSGSEDDLRVFMCVTLVISREVQVNIRLLIPFESQEGFERNVKSILRKRFAADRAFLIRHIPATAAGIGSHLF